MVSKISSRDFSLEDEPRAESQRIKTNKLQTLLDINSARTEKELAAQLCVTQQAISVCLRTIGKIQEEDEFRMNYPKTTKIDGGTLRPLCFQGSRKKIFCTKSL